MRRLNSFYAAWTPRFLSLLRVVAAFMLMAHGAQKLFGFTAPPDMPPFAPLSQMWVGGVLEFFGGLLLLLGLFTRPAAFVLSGMLAVAYFQMHSWAGFQKSGFAGAFWPIKNGGELAVLYCFVLIFFAVAPMNEGLRGRAGREGSGPFRAAAPSQFRRLAAERDAAFGDDEVQLSRRTPPSVARRLRLADRPRDPAPEVNGRGLTLIARTLVPH